jgi:hypothetical protein
MLVLPRFGMCRRCCCPFFVYLAEQPGLQRDGGSLALRMIMPEATRLKDYGA